MKIAAWSRKARESLSDGLAALQEGDAPERLLIVAEPLAQALGMLVEMEVAAPTLARKGAVRVLAALRETLALLQQPENLDVPAAERALGHVAEALSLVREIEQSTDTPKRELAPTPLGLRAPAEAAPRVEAGGGQAPTRAARGVVVGKADAPVPAAMLLETPATPVLGAVTPRTTSNASDVGESAGGVLPAVEAALGAHSATNFYKGLLGGDVLASGGLFVATYQVPEVGQTLRLVVSMPGGYAFEARGVVAWTREVRPAATAGASPGFGAQLREVSDEGRGLIQRYVRNREPLVHEDA
jgi:Tfp pilus assembly protein PilZ